MGDEAEHHLSSYMRKSLMSGHAAPGSYCSDGMSRETRMGRPKSFLGGVLAFRASQAVFDERAQGRSSQPYPTWGSDPCAVHDTRPNDEHAPVLLACIESHASMSGCLGIYLEEGLWPAPWLLGISGGPRMGYRCSLAVVAHCRSSSLQVDRGECTLNRIRRKVVASYLPVQDSRTIIVNLSNELLCTIAACALSLI